jgi:general L-amino acid transport system substrate-binding protein
MVPKKLGVKSAKEMNGASICVPSGSTTELNVAGLFPAMKMTFKAGDHRGRRPDPRRLLLRPLRRLHRATRRASTPRAPPTPPSPTTTRSLPEIISKEPLSPVVRHGDSQFAGHRALVAVRHARGRGVRHHLERTSTRC